MRIRRRPQGQALIPSPLQQQQQALDPFQPPNAAGNQELCPPQREESFKPEELHSRRPNVDLEADREHSPPALPSHPQAHTTRVHRDNVVGRSDNAQGRGGARRQAGAAADGRADAHGSPENGRRDESEWPVISAAGGGHVNGAMPATPVMSSTTAVHPKELIRNDGTKRRRGPAMLLEGSRCSRVNGRRWRCSQPTLVGYSLCEYHLGKGRQNRSANGGGRHSAGAPKLGRTRPSGRMSATALAVVTVATAAPDVNEPPTLGHI